MLTTPHVIIGIAIATKVTPLWASIPLSFASHFVLDMVPHWNPHLNTEMRTYGKITTKTKSLIYADTALASVILLISLLTANSMTLQINLFLCAVAAVTPDLLEAPYFFLHMKNAFLIGWIKFQKSIQSDAGPILGVLTQVIVSIAALVWMLRP